MESSYRKVISHPSDKIANYLSVQSFIRAFHIIQKVIKDFIHVSIIAVSFLLTMFCFLRHLIKEVEKWIEEKGDEAKEAFEVSAKEVIEKLKAIEAEISN